MSSGADYEKDDFYDKERLKFTLLKLGIMVLECTEVSNCYNKVTRSLMEQVTTKFRSNVELSQEQMKAIPDTIAQVFYNLVIPAPNDIEKSLKSTDFQTLKDLGFVSEKDKLDQCCRAIAIATIEAYEQKNIQESILTEFKKYKYSVAADSGAAIQSATTIRPELYFADIKISSLIAWSSKLAAFNEPVKNPYKSALAIILPNMLINSESMDNLEPVQETHGFSGLNFLRTTSIVYRTSVSRGVDSTKKYNYLTWPK